ncbi:MAG: hypothetical protein IJ180_00685 [Bacteroidales bacterium]|nr:hypothetical protein [Bacteroidales bacterium]
MTNAVVTSNAQSVIISDKQRKQNIIVNLVKNQQDVNFYSFAFGLITYGLVFKGQDKTDDEKKLICEVFCKECKERFPYLTVKQIELAVKHNKYGEYGITVEGLINCIDNYYSTSTKVENKRLEEEFNKPETPKLQLPESIDEKNSFLKRAFQYWKQCGHVHDISGQIWDYSQELYGNKYQPSIEDRRRYLLNAKEECYNWFVYKDKFKWRTPLKVRRDKSFCRSRPFLSRLKSEYREFYLRDFFKRCNWNKPK